MKVTLVQSTSNPVKLITDVASICYGNEEAAHPDKLLMHLFKNGHHSTFEHVYFTFKIEGISRTCLAQLTRHRHASYSVRSQRYCNENEQDFRFPPSIEIGSEEEDIFNGIFSSTRTSYDDLIKLGVKKEDARFILPQATTTDLYMSFNLREFLHMFSLRTTKAAQWEIRDLMIAMLEEILKVNPELDVLIEGEKV